MDQTGRMRSILLLTSCVFICAGYYLPWYSLVFSPPGGYAVISGQQIYSFTYAMSGLNSGITTTSELLYPLILITFLIGLFHLAKATLSPQAANQVIQKVGQFFKSKITGSVTDCLHALVHILIALAWLSFLFLYIGMLSFAAPKLFANQWGTGADAMKAAQYMSVHFGIGMISLFSGLLIAAITLFRYVAINVLLIILAWIITSVLHLPYFGELLHLLGY